MSGTLEGLPPVTAAVLYSFEHTLQDVHRWTEGLTDQQLWRAAGDIASVGFHIRHIAGSVDRLITYAAGGQLTAEQLAALAAEKEVSGPGRTDLLAILEERLRNAVAVVRAIDPAQLEEMREIGRKRTPVPLGVLLVHICEHTQRHTGAAIVTAKLARVSGE